MKHLEHILWDEWLTIPFIKPVEDEIAGIINGLNYRKDSDYYVFSSRRLFTIRRLLYLFSEIPTFNKTMNAKDVIQIINTNIKGKTVFRIKESMAKDIILRSSSFGRRERNWNWIRGVWGSCGSLYLPKSGYYLVIRLPENNSIPDRLQSILKSAGFSIGVRKRIKTRELILRNQQQIVTLLSRLGFVRTTLALEETAILRMMRNRANKLVNCDSANINKSLAVAQNQLQTIKKLETQGLVETLPEHLKELVFLRKENPSATLGELGQFLSRPITKSTVKYRRRKLEEVLRK
jgi:hypothetical protein